MATIVLNRSNKERTASGKDLLASINFMVQGHGPTRRVVGGNTVCTLSIWRKKAASSSSTAYRRKLSALTIGWEAHGEIIQWVRGEEDIFVVTVLR